MGRAGQDRRKWKVVEEVGKGKKKIKSVSAKTISGQTQNDVNE